MAKLGIVLRLGMVLLLILSQTDSRGLPEPTVRNLRARFDAVSNSIYVEWDYAPPETTAKFDIEFVVRYRVINRMSSDSQWRLSRTAEKSVRLHLIDIRSGDELEVQVKVERGGRVIEDWGQQLLISVAKKLNVGGVLVEEDELLPPLNFAANVFGPRSVKLEWQAQNSHIAGLYYIVNVKQLTAQSGENLFRQQIKIEATNFILNDLVPGERYEMTIRSATSPTEVSSTAAIVEISMPKEDEYFEVGNLIISSRFMSNGRGIVNLTWEVPPHMIGKIKEYKVEYAPVGVNTFNQIPFTGQQPSATLYDLQSDTEYVLHIKTLLANNLETQSGEFRFKTPKIAVNPISKVDVIYSSSESDAVRLQWILEPHVSLDLVSGYDVYISEDKDAPENNWRYIRLDGKEASLSVSDLKTSTTYYVRINVRRIDGFVYQAPSIYRFKTIDNFAQGVESRQANSLSYKNIAPGKVSITWTYPVSIEKDVRGALILYSDNKHLPYDQWRHIRISDSQTTSIVLHNLRLGTQYYVQIIPRLSNNELDYRSAEKFELHTDSLERSSAFEHAFLNRAKENEHFQELRVAADDDSERTHLNIVSCNPDAFENGCGWDEHCIPTVDNINLGWCIPDSVRDSILKSAAISD